MNLQFPPNDLLQKLVKLANDINRPEIAQASMDVAQACLHAYGLIESQQKQIQTLAGMLATQERVIAIAERATGALERMAVATEAQAEVSKWWSRAAEGGIPTPSDEVLELQEAQAEVSKWSRAAEGGIPTPSDEVLELQEKVAELRTIAGSFRVAIATAIRQLESESRQVVENDLRLALESNGQ